MRPIELRPRSFFRSFLIYIVPGLILSIFLSLFVGPPDWLSESRMALLSTAILIVVVAPLVETFILIYPTSLAGQAQTNRWAASVIGAAPLTALHIVNGWPSVVCVAWSFVWSAYCWLSLSERETRFWPRYAFLVSLHAMSNALVMVLSAFD